MPWGRPVPSVREYQHRTPGLHCPQQPAERRVQRLQRRSRLRHSRHEKLRHRGRRTLRSSAALPVERLPGFDRPQTGHVHRPRFQRPPWALRSTRSTHGSTGHLTETRAWGSRPRANSAAPTKPRKGRRVKQKRDPSHTRQSPLILAAFRPWGGSQGDAVRGVGPHCRGRGDRELRCRPPDRPLGSPP